MDERRFWEIVESSKAAARGSFKRHEKELESQLSKCSPEDIAAFDHIFSGLQIRAYSWDLWGAAYLIHGGCGDDSFTDFRSWLISLGRESFERALADADSLVEIEIGPGGEEDAFFEEFAYVAARVYEKKARARLPGTGHEYPTEPSGEDWEEDGDDLANRFPRLFARYGQG